MTCSNAAATAEPTAAADDTFGIGRSPEPRGVEGRVFEEISLHGDVISSEEMSEGRPAPKHATGPRRRGLLGVACPRTAWEASAGTVMPCHIGKGGVWTVGSAWT